MRAALFTATALIAMSSAATAQSPAFVGKWAQSKAICREEPEAIITTKRFKIIEYDCKLDPAAQIDKNTWHINAMCDSLGERMRDSFYLKVNGKRMIVQTSKGTGTVNYVRC